MMETPVNPLQGNGIPDRAAVELPLPESIETGQDSGLDPLWIEGPDEELCLIFFEEARAHLDWAEEALLKLLVLQEDANEVERVFLAFHTLRGKADFLGLDEIRDRAHEAVSLMDGVRRRTTPLDARTIEALRAAVNAIRGRLCSPGFGANPG